MRDVLVHLERVGFDAAPRWRGLDEKGRDVLTFLEGETFSDTRRLTWSDGQLAAAGALLRRYHDAVAGTELAGGSEVVSHGDYGPWNLIWLYGVPRFIIDFDNVHPGPRLRTSVMRSGSLRSKPRRRRSFAGTGCQSNARDAVDFAKQRERERFTQNDWPITF